MKKYIDMDRLERGECTVDELVEVKPKDVSLGTHDGEEVAESGRLRRSGAAS